MELFCIDEAVVSGNEKPKFGDNKHTIEYIANRTEITGQIIFSLFIFFLIFYNYFSSCSLPAIKYIAMYPNINTPIAVHTPLYRATQVRIIRIAHLMFFFELL
jgi:hypothetical protein